MFGDSRFHVKIFWGCRIYVWNIYLHEWLDFYSYINVGKNNDTWSLNVGKNLIHGAYGNGTTYIECYSKSLRSIGKTISIFSEWPKICTSRLHIFSYIDVSPSHLGKFR